MEFNKFKTLKRNWRGCCLVRQQIHCHLRWCRLVYQVGQNHQLLVLCRLQHLFSLQRWNLISAKKNKIFIIFKKFLKILNILAVSMQKTIFCMITAKKEKFLWTFLEKSVIDVHFFCKHSWRLEFKINLT